MANALPWIVAPVYLYEQNFDSGVKPPGWTSGGSPVYNFTPAIDGAFSLSIVSPNFAYYTANDSYSEIFCYFRAQTNNSFTNAALDFALQVNQANTQCRVIIQAGVVKIQVPDASHSASVVTAPIANTPYHFWMHYVKGTGANAIGSVGFSTTGIRPTSGNNYAEFLTGTSTLAVNTVDCDNIGSAPDPVLYDKIRLSTTQIGDNPL